MTLEEQVARDLQALGVAADAPTPARMVRYLRLIEQWNKVYNLTAVRDVSAMLTHHLLDSVAVLSHVHGDSLVDVGSGAGLPGIPLAMLMPGMSITLLDSNQKKAAFLREAVIELELSNATVVCDRAESWKPVTRFDIVISRAFAELAQFVKVAGHLCGKEGSLLAMKGIYPHEELNAIPGGYKVADVHTLTVPGLDAARHLVVIKPEAVPVEASR